VSPGTADAVMAQTGTGKKKYLKMRFIPPNALLLLVLKVVSFGHKSLDRLLLLNHSSRKMLTKNLSDSHRTTMEIAY
jgi:hypothetical protein